MYGNKGLSVYELEIHIRHIHMSSILTGKGRPVKGSMAVCAGARATPERREDVLLFSPPPPAEALRLLLLLFPPPPPPAPLIPLLLLLRALEIPAEIRPPPPPPVPPVPPDWCAPRTSPALPSLCSASSTYACHL